MAATISNFSYMSHKPKNPPRQMTNFAALGVDYIN